MVRENFSTPTEEEIRAPEQIKAVRVAEQKKEVILVEYPQVADDYREGLTYDEIATKYDIADKHGITQEIAKTAVSLAINILLGSERAKVTSEHQATKKARGGQKTFEQKTGIHVLSHEERSDFGKKGAQINTIEKGIIPWHGGPKVLKEGWKLDEGDYCLYLATRQKRESGKLRRNTEQIADELNRVFHYGQAVRTADTVSDFLSAEKKRDKKLDLS